MAGVIMTIPATAGVALTEERLRAYIKCSQFFHYGGEEQAALETKMAQYATEYWLSASVRTPYRERAYKLSRAVLYASKSCSLDSKYLAGQTEKYTNLCTMWIDEFLDLFKPAAYIPVMGPLPWRTVVSKTPVDLHVSGIFRTTKNKTLHVLNFTPYKHKHSHSNDPIVHLKMHALKDFVRRHPGRPQTVMHFLWSTESGQLGYNRISSIEASPTYLKSVEKVVQQIESDYHFPVLPCRYTCPFKNKCFPGVKNA